ncbi:MAG: hypothetical protein IPK79_10215 [Vampirovibrionales bacterium]|nr:hypothetical protein [Vampirovibrionales bacterium]
MSSPDKQSRPLSGRALLKWTILALVSILVGLLALSFFLMGRGSKYFKVLRTYDSIYRLNSVLDLKDGRLLIGPEHFYLIKQNRIVPTKRKLVCERFMPEMLQLLDKRILIYGGSITENPSDKCREEVAEILDLKTEKFTPVFNISAVTSRTSGIMLPDGRVFFIGGFAKQQKDTTGNRIWLFDAKTNEIKIVGHLIIPRNRHTLLRLPDDNILIAGGSFAVPRPIFKKGEYKPIPHVTLVELFNTKTYKTTSVTNLKFVRNSKTALIPLKGDKVAVIGGIDPTIEDLDSETFHEHPYFNKKEPIEIIDLNQKTSSVANTIPQPKSSPAVFALPDGKIIIIGGGAWEQREKTFRSVFIFDPQRNRVDSLDPLHSFFAGPVSVQTDNADIYLLDFNVIQKFSYEQYRKDKKKLK